MKIKGQKCVYVFKKVLFFQSIDIPESHISLLYVE